MSATNTIRAQRVAAILSNSRFDPTRMNLPVPEQFHEEDAPGLVSLSQSVGWPHTIEDWRTTLRAGIVFGHRDHGGQVVSSSAVYLYGSELASIGVVIVRAESRRQGLGRAAVLRCLEAAGGRPVMLVSTDDGFPLYQQLGFRTVEMVQNLFAPAPIPRERPADEPCRRFDPADFPALFALDRVAFGADRSALLQERWKQASGGAILPEEHGFAWKIPQNERLVIGPVVADDSSAALRMIRFLVAGHEGPARLDVFRRHPELIAKLVALGFEPRAARPLMLKNAGELPGERGRLYATAALAYG